MLGRRAMHVRVHGQLSGTGARPDCQREMQPKLVWVPVRTSGLLLLRRHETARYSWRPLQANYRDVNNRTKAKLGDAGDRRQ